MSIISSKVIGCHNRTFFFRFFNIKWRVRLFVRPSVIQSLSQSVSRRIGGATVTLRTIEEWNPVRRRLLYFIRRLLLPSEFLDFTNSNEYLFSNVDAGVT